MTEPSTPTGKKLIGRPPVAPEIRFWKYVKKTDTCWLWAGKIARNGYGHFTTNHSQSVGAHRFSYEMHRGPIPPGMQVCHDCPDGDRKDCVNPDHLFLGDGFDNMQDASRKGRMPIGERNSHAKLTTDQILEIRALEGQMKQVDIARAYGISRVHVRYIWRRKSWTHI